MMNLAQIATALGGVVAGGQVLAPAPGHSPADRGMSIKLNDAGDDIVVHLFNGGDPLAAKDEARGKLGIERPGRKRRDGNGHARPNDEIDAILAGDAAPPPPRGKPDCFYDYRDQAGKPVYRVERYSKPTKEFRQCRHDGNGGFIRTKVFDGVERVPYHLPELVSELAAFPLSAVLITEGEKDCDNVRRLGIIATCAAGNVWTSGMAKVLAGRFVYILADHDEAGKAHATRAATALYGLAHGIHIVEFTDLAKGGDVSDWLAIEGNGSSDALLRYCSGTPAFDPAAEAPKVEPDKVAPGKVEPLPLVYYDDFGTAVRKRWLLKGIIARGETSAWVGPPGAGKSALLSEIAVHCSAGIDWRGHRAKGRCGVVIFALERADLCQRRLAAYHRPGSPIAVSGRVIDLLNPDCAPLIVSTVRKAEHDLGLSIGLIVIDTYSKGIAAGAGDEDKARDQNRAAANLGKVKEALDVHVALVGHTGKDESRGARGSNAHLGDVDIMVQISGDNVAKLAQVVKANDQAERAVAEFKMEPVDLGLDEDGDMQTIWIVSAEHGEISAAKANRGKAKRGLPAVPNAALRQLFELIADGETVKRPENVHVPVGVTCVTHAKWKERLANRGLINMDGSHRTQMHRINVTLSNAGIIGIWGEIVWPVT